MTYRACPTCGGADLPHQCCFVDGSENCRDCGTPMPGIPSCSSPAEPSEREGALNLAKTWLEDYDGVIWHDDAHEVARALVEAERSLEKLTPDTHTPADEFWLEFYDDEFPRVFGMDAPGRRRVKYVKATAAESELAKVRAMFDTTRHRMAERLGMTPSDSWHTLESTAAALRGEVVTLRQQLFNRAELAAFESEAHKTELCYVAMSERSRDEARIAELEAERDAAIALAESLRWLPNRWPQPTFLSVDEDGALNIEWCFGEQDSPESHRIMFVWDPAEPAMACRTTRDGQEYEEGERAGAKLDEWLQSEASAKKEGE